MIDNIDEDDDDGEEITLKTYKQPPPAPFSSSNALQNKFPELSTIEDNRNELQG